MQAFDPKVIRAVALEIWTFRRERQRWPESHEVLDFLEPRKLSLEQMATFPGFRRPASRHESIQDVRLSWEAVASLPQGLDYFAPLPKIVREAAARVRAYPPFVGKGTEQGLTFPPESMTAAWGSCTAAHLAAEVLESNPLGIRFSIQKDGTVTATARLDALKHRRAKTAADLFASVLPRPMGTAFAPIPPVPREEHVRFMQSLLDYAQKHEPLRSVFDLQALHRPGKRLRRLTFQRGTVKLGTTLDTADLEQRVASSPPPRPAAPAISVPVLTGLLLLLNLLLLMLFCGRRAGYRAPLLVAACLAAQIATGSLVALALRHARYPAPLAGDAGLFVGGAVLVAVGWATAAPRQTASAGHLAVLVRGAAAFALLLPMRWLR